ncbi:DUF202 domain-containing protein [Streptomyces sp. NPDC057199]|uniref:DUF202 domain-containing protein n=1 Tax=Streptomyces sp. NPDC057199 TaxID=3346047 RepID=UPI003629FCE6
MEPHRSAEDDRDPGLQPERTRLAWRRTTLAGTVATVLAVKAALNNGTDAPGITVAALCCALWLGFLTVAHRRIRVLAEGGKPTPLTPRHAGAATLCTVALAACAVALIL